METPTTTLAPAILEDLQTAFAVVNCLEFARHLHTLDIPDAMKSEWLRAKVTMKPSEREEAMQDALSRAMDSFWNRLAEGK